MSATDERIAYDVQHAAKIMDERKPSWFRRVVFKRLDMTAPCDCIAGQSGLDWEDVQDEFEDRYPDSFTMPFADSATEPAWRHEIRKRRAS